MAEPTLSLTFNQLQQAVGVFAGWGSGTGSDPSWNTFQSNQIQAAIDSGLRMFYYPEMAAGDKAIYDWSFLHPTASLTFASGASTIALPDDYGGVADQTTILTSGTASQPFRIEWRNEGEVRAAYSAQPSRTGPPVFVSEQAIKGTAASAGQRYQLFLFPLADQTYTLQLPYYVNPNTLTSGLPYPYGGTQHAETIKEACLAAFEVNLDDTGGVHLMRFKERLAASIAMDRKMKPLKMGPNLDRSDEYGVQYNQHYYGPMSTYNGGPWV